MSEFKLICLLPTFHLMLEVVWNFFFFFFHRAVDSCVFVFESFCLKPNVLLAELVLSASSAGSRLQAV